MNITRDFLKTQHFNKTKPERFSIEQLEDFEKLKNNERYQKWLSGINPNTNRKIDINGRLYKKIGKEFIYIHQDPRNKIQDIQLYSTETDNLLYQYENERTSIDKYNNAVQTVNEKIKSLKYNEYIELCGIKYGIPKYYNNICRVNDCLGEFESEYIPCGCHSCEDWNAGHEGKTKLRCKKCNIEYLLNPVIQTYKGSYR